MLIFAALNFKNMRTFKFRGKTENGEWKYGMIASLGNNDNKVGIFNEQSGDFDHVIEESVGQFTCYMTTDNQEIYEKDLLSCDSELYALVCYPENCDGAFIKFIDKHTLKETSATTISLKDLFSTYKNISVAGNLFDIKNPRHELIICRGIPASGKTTYAKAWCKQKPENRVRLNFDDLRYMMNPVYKVDGYKMLDDLKNSFLNSAVLHHYDIIIDNMNLNPKDIEFYKNFVKDYPNYQLKFRDFKSDVEVCMERDEEREHPVGRNVIKRIAEKYKDFYDKNE